MTNFAAVMLFLGVVLYAIFGGADFGAGFWDLTAGGVERGRRPRWLIDENIGPVWEANHVWLIYSLVVSWTAFSSAFAAIMTTLYIPLGLAALGIVLRGSGFAFRKVVAHSEAQRVNGAAFAVSSIVTPFFMGTVAGGIASGRVPTAGNGNGISSWVNPTGLLGGFLAVATCAYLAAVFLTADARARRDFDLEEYFRGRALAAAAVAGALAIAGIFILRSDAHRLYQQLLRPGLPLVILSAVTGLAVLVLLGSIAPTWVRSLAAVAVGAIVTGWGVAQYPYLLGTHLSISQAAAPRATLWTLAVVFVAAALVVLPSLAFLFVLQQRRELESV